MEMAPGQWRLGGWLPITSAGAPYYPRCGRPASLTVREDVEEKGDGRDLQRSGDDRVPEKQPGEDVLERVAFHANPSPWYSRGPSRLGDSWKSLSSSLIIASKLISCSGNPAFLQALRTRSSISLA